MKWDPQQYERYATERSRPFIELVARVGARDPKRIVDLGCGPGTATVYLTERWPDAQVEGLDSSPEMIAAAAPLANSRLTFTVADAQTWTMPSDLDVLVTNALLQWVPNHVDLLVAWAKGLPADGWLAMQVPGNFAAPTHALMRELAASPRWRASLDGVLRHHDTVAAPTYYASRLQDAGLEVDVWETTYVHVLAGEDPVIEWLLGTGLRPVLDALPKSESDEFVAEFSAELRREYPPSEHGTLLPYRRVFAVGHRA